MTWINVNNLAVALATLVGLNQATGEFPREAKVAKYLVKFFKTVENDTGHMADVCQGWFEVFDASKESAAEEAKKRFCQRDKLSSWSLHADRYEVAESEFPS